MRQGEPGRGGNKKMTYRAGIACALLGATLCVGAPARSEEKAAAAKPGSTVVVDVRSDRIVLLETEIARLRAAIESKKQSKSAADAFFKL